MSAENVHLLRRVVESWNAGEVDPVLDILDAEVEIHTPFSSVAGEPYRGVAGYRQWRADIADQFETWELHVDEIRALESDQVLAIGFAHVRGRGSGIEFDQPAAGLVEIREGHLLRVRIYLSHREALKAVGLEG